jgi:hypothetical protein
VVVYILYFLGLIDQALAEKVAHALFDIVNDIRPAKAQRSAPDEHREGFLGTAEKDIRPAGT